MFAEKILVVDDEPDHLALVQRWLEDDGYEVHTAVNGWDGLEAMVQHRPDLTITDICMPRMDGFQLIKRIREISDGHVLALTRLGDEEDVIHGLELGADEYLHKPISKRMFLVRVRSILRRAETPDEVPAEYTDECLSMNFLTHVAQLHGESLSLRPTEFRLLSYLARNNNTVICHEDLLDQVWGIERGIRGSGFGVRGWGQLGLERLSPYDIGPARAGPRVVRSARDGHRSRHALSGAW